MQMWLAQKSKINSNVPNDKPNWQRQFTHNKSVKFSLKPGHPHTHTPDTHTGASNFKCCQFPSQFNAKTDRPLSIYVCIVYYMYLVCSPSFLINNKLISQNAVLARLDKDARFKYSFSIRFHCCPSRVCTFFNLHSNNERMPKLQWSVTNSEIPYGQFGRTLLCLIAKFACVYYAIVLKFGV